MEEGKIKRSLISISTDLDARVSKESICGLKFNQQSMVTPRYLEGSYIKIFEIL